MPTITVLFFNCEHGDFDVDPWNEGGCQLCKEQGLKRYNAVKNGNYKFINFGKRNSDSNRYIGDIVWCESNNAKDEITDKCIKLYEENQLIQYMEVTERKENPSHYSTDLNVFWSMIYHFKDVDKCIEFIESNEWMEEGEEEHEKQHAFTDFFSSMMDNYDDYDEDDEEMDVYHESSEEEQKDKKKQKQSFKKQATNKKNKKKRK